MLSAENLVHFAADAAFAVNQEQRLLAANRQFEELLGYQGHEILGRPCYEVLQAVLPGGQPLCTPDCQAKWLFGRCRPHAARNCLCRRKDGEWVKVQMSSIAVPGANSDDATDHDDGAIGVVLLRPLEQSLIEAPPTPTLRAFTLGRFGLVVGDQGIAVARWHRKQALALLKYLLTDRGHAVHRERLIDSLWPDAAPRQGRERLKVTVYFLRQQLRQAGIRQEVIGMVDGAYFLRREEIWIDVDAFESRVREGRTMEREHRLVEALRCYEDAQDLYRGDYFEEDPYADWCAEERERLRELYLDMLGRTAEAYVVQGDYAEAALVCRKALAREPCRESMHRVLMGCLAQLGRLDEALAQFDRCGQVLARELGVEPMPETKRLHRELRATARPAAAETAAYANRP